MKVVFNGTPDEVDNPNICPHCHITIVPQLHWNAPTTIDDNTPAYLSIWGCTNENCKKLFVVIYTLNDFEDFVISKFLGGLPKGPDWPKPIIELKSGQMSDENGTQTKFIKTYLQSLEAESLGLDELAGMGYRKSIEYLVKDWAIKNNLEQKEQITQMWLGNVIKKYYSDDLKDILDRATWLGNDQAHYHKLFDEYDINILKELIDLIMVELDREYKKSHYIKSIQSKK